MLKEKSLNNLTDDVETIKESLQQIKLNQKKTVELLNELKQEIDCVTIKNGGGVNVTFRRKDFDQRNYTKPTFEDVGDLIKNEMKTYPEKRWKKLVIKAGEIAVIASLIAVILRIVQ